MLTVKSIENIELIDLFILMTALKIVPTSCSKNEGAFRGGSDSKETTIAANLAQLCERFDPLELPLLQ